MKRTASKLFTFKTDFVVGPGHERAQREQSQDGSRHRPRYRDELFQEGSSDPAEQERAPEHHNTVCEDCEERCWFKNTDKCISKHCTEFVAF